MADEKIKTEEVEVAKRKLGEDGDEQVPKKVVKLEDVPQEMLTKVSEQLRFYFGNVNMLRDRFMKDVMMKNEGWFPIATLLTFNRLKNLLKEYDEEKSLEIVVDGAKKLTMLEVHADEKLVRRDQSMEFPKTRPESNTLVVKGFKTEDVTVDDFLDFFKKYEGVEAVIMRNYREKVVECGKAADGEKTTEVVKIEEEEEVVKNGKAVEISNDKPELGYRKKFKGSVFVVFDTTDNAKICLDALKEFKEESKLLNSEAPFEVMWQSDHKLRKQEETKARQELKKKADAKPEDTFALKPGTVIRVKQVPSDVYRENVKFIWDTAIKDFKGEEDLSVAFIDYKLGTGEGLIRLKAPFAKQAIEFMEGKLVHKDQPAMVLSEMEAEAEEVYLKEVVKTMSETKRTKYRGGGGGGGRGRGRGRGGRGGGRRR